ncbi:1,6-dihydroxycyclohexa-2,4-diene-1-carboxylate dehydrogenase [Lysobacter sp. A289]
MARADRFTGKSVVVTGAAQGIGREVALDIAREGGRLVLADRAAFLDEVVAEARALGADCEGLNVDLETWAGAQAVMDLAIARYGRIDVLVNNVGGTIWARPFEHYGEAQIEAEIRRSLFPTLWCCRAALPQMLEQGAGAIVNVSSIATRSIHRVPYAAAKGGVNALTASLAFECGGRGVRVNAVAPGGTEAPLRKVPRNTESPTAQEARWYQAIVEQTTDSTLMKRYGTLAEQAAAILFLASDEASYITGTVLPVGGGDQG